MAATASLSTDMVADDTRWTRTRIGAHAAMCAYVLENGARRVWGAGGVDVVAHSSRAGCGRSGLTTGCVGGRCRSAPLTAPDLAASRAAIDALNQTMVEEIARQWDSLHAPQCPADLGRAVEVVAESRKLDDVYRRALAFATHSYCG